MSPFFADLGGPVLGACFGGLGERQGKGPEDDKEAEDDEDEWAFSVYCEKATVKVFCDTVIPSDSGDEENCAEENEENPGVVLRVFFDEYFVERESKADRT